MPAIGRPLAERLVADVLRPGAGARCLDLPCGSGVLAAALAAAVGPQGRVTAADPHPTARAACAEGVAALRLTTVEVRAAPDAGGFDGAASLLTLPHRGHPAGILATAAAALRPHGRLAAAVWGWGSPGAAPVEAAAAALAAAGGGIPEPLDAALRWGRDGAAGLRGLAAAAGLAGAGVVGLRDVVRFEGPAHLLAAVCALCGAGAELEALDDAAVGIAIETLGLRLLPVTRPDGTLVIPVELAVLVWSPAGP